MMIDSYIYICKLYIDSCFWLANWFMQTLRWFVHFVDSHDKCVLCMMLDPYELHIDSCTFCCLFVCLLFVYSYLLHRSFIIHLANNWTFLIHLINNWMWGDSPNLHFPCLNEVNADGEWNSQTRVSAGCLFSSPNCKKSDSCTCAFLCSLRAILMYLDQFDTTHLAL